MVAPACCAVCGVIQARLREPLRAVQFADYVPFWQPPEPDDDMGTDSRNANSSHVYGPEGIGSFCPEHLAPATRLRQLTLAEAVAQLKRDQTIPYTPYAAPSPHPNPTYYEPHLPLRNGLGVASLVTAAVAFFPGTLTCILGLVLGIAAVAMGFQGRRRVKRGEANNGGIAIAGVIVGSVAIVTSLLFTVMTSVVLAGFYDYYECTSHSNSKGHPECE
jgi:hypothetical protein